MFSLFKRLVSGADKDSSWSFLTPSSVTFCSDYVCSLKGEDRALIAADIPFDLHRIIHDSGASMDDTSSISGLSLAESDRTTSSLASSSSSSSSSLKNPHRRIGPYGVIAQVTPPRTFSHTSKSKTFSIFCIYDGHGGSKAAEFLQRAFLDRFLERLPPPSSVPDFDTPVDAESPAWVHFSQAIRHAAAAAISSCEAQFARYGIASGSTLSIVCLTGPLATVINLGDSSVWMDTGMELVKLSVDHQVGSNGSELQRLVASGARLAQLHMSMTRPTYPGEAEGVGPLRLWPGGLALSRSFGDLDLDNAPLVLSNPQITQVLVPSSGCRFVCASDGVWNAFPSDELASRFLAKLRKSLPKATVKALLEETVYKTGLKDDATCIVVDVPGTIDSRPFPEVCQGLRSAGPSNAKHNQYLGGLRDGLSTGLPLAPSGRIVCSVDYGSICPASRSHPQPPLDNVLSVQLSEEKAKSRDVWLRFSANK